MPHSGVIAAWTSSCLPRELNQHGMFEESIEIRKHFFALAEERTRGIYISLTLPLSEGSSP